MKRKYRWNWIQQTQEKLNKISKAEKIVAKVLEENEINYTRNHPIYFPGGLYFVDFFLWHNCLIIEIDGKEHDPVADAVRDEHIKTSTDFRIIRFTNDDVFCRLDKVRSKINEEAPVKFKKPSTKKAKKAMRKAIYLEKKFLRIQREEQQKQMYHLASIARGL